MAKNTTLEPANLQPNRPKSSRWRQAIQATGVATTLALAGTGYKLTDPGEDGRQARVFTTPYSEVVSGFLRENPDWVGPKGGASHSNIGKSNNLPYEGPPLAVFGPDKKLVDLAYPQSSSLTDRISLTAFLEKNNIPSSYLARLHDVLLSEHNLMHKNVRTMRWLVPDTLSDSLGNDRSHSAMKVKPRSTKDYSPRDQQTIVVRAMTYQMQPAKRDRVVSLGRDVLQTDGSYHPLYQILGYKDAQSATRAFIEGKISTTGEVGFALGVSILTYIQEQIDAGMQKTGVTTDASGTITASFPAALYTDTIYPIIKTAGGYNTMPRPVITPKEIALDRELADLRTRIDALTPTRKNQKLLTSLKRRQSILTQKKAEFKTARDIELQNTLSQVANSHLTLTRSDLNTVGTLLTEINRAAAYYPTNVNRALGKEGLGTYDQFMLNLISWNKTFGKGEKPVSIPVDGDPGPATKNLIAQYSLTDDTKRKTAYDRALDQSLQNMVTWKPQIDAAIAGKESPFSKDLSTLAVLSFEHRYVFVRILASYLSELETIPGVDRGAITRLRATIDTAWTSYIAHMNEKPFRDLLDRISDPRNFATEVGLTQHKDKVKFINSFYTRWLIPRLVAMNYHLGKSGIVMPIIQNYPPVNLGLFSGKFIAIPTGNTSNTLNRAVNNPSSTLSIAPENGQNYRQGPRRVPGPNGGLFSEQYYDTKPIQVSNNQGF